MFILIIFTSIIILFFLIYTNYESFSSNNLSKKDQNLLDKSNHIIRYKDIKALRAENYLEIVELLKKKKSSKTPHKPDKNNKKNQKNKKKRS